MNINLQTFDIVNKEQYRVYQYIAGSLIEGSLALGSKLEPEFELAKKFSTTRMNVYRAIKQFERRGIVQRSKRAGTTVAMPLTQDLLRQLKSEVSRRVCVIHSRNRYEYLHWNQTFQRTLRESLGSEGITIDEIHLDSICDRAALKEKLMELTDSGITAFVLSVRGAEDEFLVENSDLFFQYHRKIFVYQSGALSWMHWPFHTVTVNIFGEGCLAAEYLFARGITHIAYCRNEISSQNYLDFNKERLQGVKFTLRRLTDGTSRPDEWIGLEEICRNYRLHDGKYALIAGNDQLAAEIIDYFEKQGLGRPENLISFDNNAEYRKYRLTTIAPPHAEAAAALGKLILENIDIDSECNSVSYIKINSEVIINSQKKENSDAETGNNP